MHYLLSLDFHCTTWRVSLGFCSHSLFLHLHTTALEIHSLPGLTLSSLCCSWEGAPLSALTGWISSPDYLLFFLFLPVFPAFILDSFLSLSAFSMFFFLLFLLLHFYSFYFSRLPAAHHLHSCTFYLLSFLLSLHLSRSFTFSFLSPACHSLCVLSFDFVSLHRSLPCLFSRFWSLTGFLLLLTMILSLEFLFSRSLSLFLSLGGEVSLCFSALSLFYLRFLPHLTCLLTWNALHSLPLGGHVLGVWVHHHH